MYLDGADDWLVLSAQLGNVKSQVELGRKLFDSEQGIDYLNMAWLQGDIEALGWLAKGHAESGDSLIAFAHQLAYSQLSRKDFEVRGVQESRIGARWMEADQRALADLRYQLSPAERNQAYEIAATLLRDNESCCLLRGIL